MPLFQQSILNKHLNALDKDKVKEKWEIFHAHFHNSAIQENIRNSKEEQYQEGFLRDLFVRVLGYTLNPSEGFNLTTEYKNVKDSKKADGAIIIDEKVKAVIELKGNDTTDLDKIEPQAFGYKNNQPLCKYIVISNFEKLRFYIENTVDYLEFNLFTLTEAEFYKLWVCLAFENILRDIPEKLKNASISQEEDITKGFYKAYSLFKRELFQNLVELNPEYNQLELFKKSQKLLDRILFLLFGEDRYLLPPNSVRLILEQWKKLMDLDEYVPLYSRFKKYFDYMNTGFKGKNHDVFAYNGGLFKPDEVLDNVKIDDELLCEHTKNLSSYNFESEVDVNILGHIFENSLNEIDEIKSQLESKEVDKTKSKRKKDGVFYTPKYITKYIVENTVGRLCEEKKNELNIAEEDYTAEKRKQIKTKQALLNRLVEYRDWLLQITIVDPACGSGAFLNQALNFLIEEHKYIDELETKLTGGSIVFQNIENSILENNLFGVDLNEESVEIAKLSLWLRTAQPNRKLNDLSANIKCGNSLIDDPEVAGDKAFNWQTEFPQVFAKGGFDVVIGNPPYVKEATNKKAFHGLHLHECYQGKMDLWYFFGWLGIEISKHNGLIGLIAPNNWITNDGASKFRNKIVKSIQLNTFIDFGDYKVFADAGIQTMILIARKVNPEKIYKFHFSKVIDKNINLNEMSEFLNKKKSAKFISFTTTFDFDKFNNNIFSFVDSTHEQILIKMNSHGNFYLNANEIFSGIDIGQDFVNAKSKNILGKEFNVGDGVFNLSQTEYKKYQFSDSEKRLIKPFYTPREINRYFCNQSNAFWVIYTTSKFKNKDEIAPFPKLKVHLDKFKSIITSDNHPYGLHRSRNEDIFLGDKILSIRKCIFPSFCFVDFDAYVNRTFNIIKSNRINLKYLTTILNSSTIKYWLHKKGKLQGELFQIDMNPLINIPIVSNFSNQQLFIDKYNRMLSLNKELQETFGKFHRSLEREFGLEKLSTKLQNWHELPYADFLKELAKAKVSLSLTQKAEWEEYFLVEQQKAQNIQHQITTTDREIDQMVYDLYELTEEERKIVES